MAPHHLGHRFLLLPVFRRRSLSVSFDRIQLELGMVAVNAQSAQLRLGARAMTCCFAEVGTTENSHKQLIERPNMTYQSSHHSGGSALCTIKTLPKTRPAERSD